MYIIMSLSVLQKNQQQQQTNRKMVYYVQANLSGCYITISWSDLDCCVESQDHAEGSELH